MGRIAVRVIVVMVVAQLAVSVPAVSRAQDTRFPASASEYPAIPAGEAFAWVLTVLNEGAASLTPEEMTARFAPKFLEEVPLKVILGLMRQIGADAPFSFEGFTRPPTATQVNALLVGRSGTPLVVPVSVEAVAPHRITGVNFAPVPPPGVQLGIVATRRPWRRARSA